MLSITRASFFGQLGRIGGELDVEKWNQFKQNQASVYSDPAVYCSKFGGALNFTSCVLQSEDTTAKRKSGQVAAMQVATDAFLNKVFQDSVWDLPIKYPDGRPYTDKMVKDPIKNAATYDGCVGPSTFGFVLLAISLASNLQLPSLFVLEFNEADVTRNAESIAIYLNDVTANFESLLAAYKIAPEPNPILLPERIPEIKAAMDSQGKGSPEKPKSKLSLGALAIGGGTVLSALTLGLAVAMGHGKKGPGSAGGGGFYPNQ